MGNMAGAQFILTSSDGVTKNVETDELSSKLHRVFSSEEFKFIAPPGSQKVDSVRALRLRHAFIKSKPYGHPDCRPDGGCFLNTG
jgi:hypothetical protein